MTGPVLPKVQSRIPADRVWHAEPTKIVSRSTDEGSNALSRWRASMEEHRLVMMFVQAPTAAANDLGRKASSEAVAPWNIDMLPDGTGRLSQRYFKHIGVHSFIPNGAPFFSTS